ncbi:hypothetical protein RM780_11770 [Streptomyces sp. DSM 44917]|uniref:Uncharacterized protein n=1 Tax=Streptomyces boetiae TaxID=3075541 RepID=A0ABU2L7V4_9ACTN|nr:hypothetical protein [Streptomyces sp. DSM 44917]MDT0307637.1 hypothetical protein [Streptomyces sp. DSM 44917]
MADLRHRLAGVFWGIDRALGGQKPPTRLQQWVARHPIRLALCAAVPAILISAPTIRTDEMLGDLLIVLAAGLAAGSLFFLTAHWERLRQRRLRRLGVWDGR